MSLGPRLRTAGGKYRVRMVEDAGEWDDIIERLPHAVAHRFSYQQALLGGRRSGGRLLVVESASVRVVCPVAVRSWAGYDDLYTPYGFGGFVGNADLRLAKDVLHMLGASRWVAGYFQQHPVVGLKPWSSNSGPVTFVVDVDRPWSEVMNGMSGRLKTKLRRWRRSAPRICDRECLERAFVDLYPDHAARVGASSVYRFDGPALTALAALPDVRLYGAGADTVEAVVMFGFTPYTADYMFGVSTPDGRAHTAGLIADALEDAAATGVSKVNLGGGIRGHDGVAEFKRRFGARAVRAPALSWIFDASTYHTLCRSAAVSPAHTDYFPAYRAARLDDGSNVGAASVADAVVACQR